MRESCTFPHDASCAEHVLRQREGHTCDHAAGSVESAKAQVDAGSCKDVHRCAGRSCRPCGTVGILVVKGGDRAQPWAAAVWGGLPAAAALGWERAGYVRQS